MSIRFFFFGLVLGCLGITQTKAASTISNYGIDFSVIGAAGNRAPTVAEMPSSPGNRKPGSVNYEYAIAKTDLTTIQYLEFVRAYSKFYTGSPADAAFTGFNIRTTVTPSGPQYDLLFPGAANRATNMSWRMAARYCNWLQNGKAMTADAFEKGAYDTSTFGRDANGNYTDQLTRSPGAKFWIPNLDEYVKATYFDPNRYGQGQAGYWQYSGKSETPLKFGLPENGGQTNAGTYTPGEQIATDVGVYSMVTSPWGLLDTCGTVTNWLEGTLYPDRPHTGVLNAGAAIGDIDQLVAEYDRLGWVSENTPPNSSWPGGLRIAMIVPSVATSVPFLFLVGLSRRKRL